MLKAHQQRGLNKMAATSGVPDSFSGKADFIHSSQEQKTQSNDLSQFKFDPSSVTSQAPHISPFEAGSFSQPKISPAVQKGIDELESLHMKSARGRPVMGKKFRQFVLDRIEEKQQFLNQGFSDFDRELIEKTGGQANEEILNHLADKRAEANDETLVRIKNELFMANKVLQIGQRKKGIEGLINLEGLKSGIDAQAKDLYLRTNARLDELSFQASATGLRGDSKIAIASQKLITDRNLLLRDMMIKKERIEAQKKRALGSFLGKLLFGGVTAAVGLGPLGLGAGTAGGDALGAALVTTGITTAGSGLGDLGGVL